MPNYFNSSSEKAWAARRGIKGYAHSKSQEALPRGVCIQLPLPMNSFAAIAFYARNAQL